MQRLHRLDGLRGVLAVYVMLGHALPFTVAPGWVQSGFSHGEAAVDVFFALSGLVIVNSLARFKGAFWPFLQARARRLLPAYFLALALAVALLAAGPPHLPWAAAAAAHIMEAALPAPLWPHLLAHILLAQGVIPQGALPYAYVTLLGPGWSLSTEWQFYIIIGLCAVKDLRVAALVMMALGLGFHAAAPYLPPWWQFSRAFLPDAAPYFALGLAAAACLRGQGLACLLLCTALAVGLGLAEGGGKVLVPLVWLAAMAAQFHPCGRVLEHRAVQFLGAISYPLYLFNEPVQRALALGLAPLGNAKLFTLLWLPLSIAGAIITAAWVHAMVEKPYALSCAKIKTYS